MANKSRTPKRATIAETKIDYEETPEQEGSCGVVAKPTHYQKLMVVDLQDPEVIDTIAYDDEGTPASCAVSIEAVKIMEAYFSTDAHLSQAWTYLARCGRKDNAQQEIAKAAWWLLRYLQHHRAEKELIELLGRYNRMDMQKFFDMMNERAL